MREGRNFGPALIAARTRSGYNQRDAAIYSGLSQGSLSQWENAIRQISADGAVSLAAAYKISVDELLGLAPPPPRRSEIVITADDVILLDKVISIFEGLKS